MGYQDRTHVFDAAASPPKPVHESKWPLHRTFWVVTVFCTIAWLAIIGVAVMAF